MALQFFSNDNRIQRHHYSNVHNHYHYNIMNNYSSDHYDYRRINNRSRPHHRPQSPHYHMNNSSHINSNRNNCDYDLTISSTYNDGKNVIYRYLESNAIISWFTANTYNTFDGLSKPYIHNYILETSILHDEWYRNNYELSVWEEYLEMGNENKYLAEEVLRYTKTRNLKINMRFIQKQIKQFQDEISEISRELKDFKVQLTTDWRNDRSIQEGRLLPISFSLQTEETTQSPPLSTTTTTQKQIFQDAFQLDNCIRQYIIQCTQYAKKLSDIKIQLAQAQLEDFRRL